MIDKTYTDIRNIEFGNWESVCKYLETRYNGQIEEITVLVIN